MDYRVPNAGLVPVHVYLESGSDGLAVKPDHQYVGGRSSAMATLTLTAPPETGYYRQYVTEHRYLALLPASVIDGLYRLHPWGPIVAIDALLAGAIGILGMGLQGGRRIRMRRRESRHSRSLVQRLLAYLTP
jgi:signal peptidase